tara:strand:+ start:2862 stop:2969 length:108 start_codon:yes stop_codon:yes gene_type:complete
MDEKFIMQGVERREWLALCKFNNTAWWIFSHNPSG